MGGLLRRVSRIVAEGVADLIVPHKCAGCGVSIKTNGELLCEDCLRGMNYIDAEMGQYLHYVSGPMIDYFPRFENIWTLTTYKSKSISSHFVLEAKNHPDKRASVYAGYLLSAIIADEVKKAGIDCIVPSPIIESRKKTRGRAQTETMCRAMGIEMGMPVVCALRNEAEDGKWWHRLLTHQDVKMLKANKFVATGEAKGLKGRHILFFDDVVTTGGSVSECVRILQEATDGDIRISLACVALKRSIVSGEVEEEDEDESNLDGI